MVRWTILAAALLASATGTARAQPIRGIYIGGEGGANFLETQKPREGSGIFLNQTRTAYETGSAGIGSVGYGFGNGLRLEVEGDFRFNRLREPDGTGSASAGGVERKYGGMVNALFDLDIGSPYVFPYFGGGIGYMQTEFREQVTFTYPGSGSLFRLRGSAGSYAYQGIGGVSFPVPGVPGLSLTAEYRFLGLGDDRNIGGRTTSYFSAVPSYLTPAPGSGVVTAQPSSTSTRERFKSDDNHSLMLGIRYAFNAPPPPMPEAALPAAGQVIADGAYLIFFDWDRADLSDRGRQVIARAAQASTRVQTTRIEVDGYTDTSGTARYNLGLSQRRAQSVAAELVRDGVPRAVITIQGFGETHPLVPTADGVREPQNRRVEIVLR